MIYQIVVGIGICLTLISLYHMLPLLIPYKWISKQLEKPADQTLYIQNRDTSNDFHGSTTATVIVLGGLAVSNFAIYVFKI